MDKKKMEKYRKILLKERASILGNNLSSDFFYENRDETTGDIADVASKLYETDFFLQLATHDQETIRLIDRALEKINDGNYGICEATQRPIEEARLEAIPWTPFCFEHARSLSRKK
jgi:DnaK suppressor protein